VQSFASVQPSDIGFSRGAQKIGLLGLAWCGGSGSYCLVKQVGETQTTQQTFLELMSAQILFIPKASSSRVA
jgi:hypothetical protein